MSDFLQSEEILGAYLIGEREIVIDRRNFEFKQWDFETEIEVDTGELVVFQEGIMRGVEWDY
uniref:Uncharacterized protein n=1 Tax=Meloidogyne incognita TaxID=6306 RepID=A0A914LZB2_MELIC